MCDNLHKKTMSRMEVHLVDYLCAIARKIAKQKGLKFKTLGVIPPDYPDIENVKGLCYPKTGDIGVVLYDIFGQFYPITELIDTVLHELSHLKYKKDQHSRRFWKYLAELRKWYFSQDYSQWKE